ncbi:MAG: M24 family metallopeptidase [Planctomycetota bacterium]
MSEFSRRGFLQFAGVAGAASLGACAQTANATKSNAAINDSDSPLADLKPMTSGLPPMPADVYQERQARLRKALDDTATSAILLGPTLNLTYFMGKSWGASERLFGCLQFDSQSDNHTGDINYLRVWIAPKFEESRARELVGKDELRTWEEWEDPHKLVLDILQERTGGGRLALDPHMRAMHASRIFTIANERKVTAADGLPIVSRVRSVKTASELARMRRANEITKKAIQTVFDRLIKPGIQESQASAWVNEAQQRLGLKNTWALVLFGPNAAFPHGTKDRRPLEAGQCALFDCGGELESYQSDITRTYFAGAAPTARQRKIYNLVRNAQIAALASAKPGVRCEEVDAAARKVISDGGFGPGSTFFTHRLGHGIGLEGHEDPYFCPGNATVLAPGMTISNEPGIYIPGELGVRLEDIIVITKDGAEILGGTLVPEI